MDINQILALLNEQKNKASATPPPPPQPPQPPQPEPVATSTATSIIPNFPEGLNLSSFDPNIINQVRQEYLAKKESTIPATTTIPIANSSSSNSGSNSVSYANNYSNDSISRNSSDAVLDELLDSLQQATTVTPDVLTAISRMVKETQLLNVLRRCKARQDKKEKELFDHRESIKARHQKQKDAIFAKELIGISDPNAIKLLEKESSQELRRMDIQIIKDMDKESRLLQEELTKLKVPLFKVTNNPHDVQAQQKVLSILVDMM